MTRNPFTTATPADRQAASEAAERNQREVLEARRQRLTDQREQSARAIKRFYKPAVECKVDERVHTNCTIAGITNQHAIRAEQEKARALIRAGGTLTTPRNHFKGAAASVKQVRAYRQSARER